MHPMAQQNMTHDNTRTSRQSSRLNSGCGRNYLALTRGNIYIYFFCTSRKYILNYKKLLVIIVLNRTNLLKQVLQPWNYLSSSQESLRYNGRRQNLSQVIYSDCSVACVNGSLCNVLQYPANDCCIYTCPRFPHQSTIPPSS